MTQNPLDANPRFFDLVGQVRAMRRLKPDPIPLEIVRKVLDAGVQASSLRFRSAIRWVDSVR